MRLRAATDDDLPSIRRLLDANGLPSEDVDEHVPTFFVMEEGGRLTGVGGLEVLGRVGLVRSIAVDAACRGHGVGRSLYGAIESTARDLGLGALYLLTETAEAYFLALGYAGMDRSDVPPEIAGTKQFKGLCPASASLMARNLAQG